MGSIYVQEHHPASLNLSPTSTKTPSYWHNLRSRNVRSCKFKIIICGFSRFSVHPITRIESPTQQAQIKDLLKVFIYSLERRDIAAYSTTVAQYIEDEANIDDLILPSLDAIKWLLPLVQDSLRGHHGQPQGIDVGSKVSSTAIWCCLVVNNHLKKDSLLALNRLLKRGLLSHGVEGLPKKLALQWLNFAIARIASGNDTELLSDEAAWFQG